MGDVTPTDLMIEAPPPFSSHVSRSDTGEVAQREAL
jgi:hypothetical protein